MDNIDEILQVINIVIDINIVASFLINTNRVKKGIEVCKECLIFLNNKALEKETAFVRLIYTFVYSTMFNGYGLINDCTSAIKCGKKLVILFHESGERVEEGNVVLAMALLHQGQCQYKEAQALYKEALSIMKEIGQRQELEFCYANLGKVCFALGHFIKARKYFEKALAITIEIGDLNEEAEAYGNLSNVFRSLGDYAKAKEYLDKTLAITKQIGDQDGEAAAYENLGTVFQSLGDYAKAKENLEKALPIKKQIGDLKGEAAAYGELGVVFHTLGDYAKAKECHEKALAINKQIGDLNREATNYGNLANVFLSLCEYTKAKEYLENAIAIKKPIGDLIGEAAIYGNLGTVFQSLGDYAKAKEYYEKALAIQSTIEIGDLNGEATTYANLGTVFQSLGDYDKAKEYLEKALAITNQIGDLKKEAAIYGNLGALFQSLGDNAKAKEYLENSIAMSKKIGDIETELRNRANLSSVILTEGNIHDAESHLFDTIKKFEDMRSFLKDYDQFKISLFEKYVDSYQVLSILFRATGNPDRALYILELGRARALADLMSSQYSVKKEISVNTQTWVGIERIMESERNCDCTCLFISYFGHLIFLWVLKANKPTLFRQIDVSECLFNKESVRTVDNVFGSEIFRNFHVLAEEQCEDRSWFPFNASHQTTESFQKDGLAGLRLVEEEDDENQQPDPTLNDCYNMIIAPVADLLDKPEIIIVPDRSLFKVPFAALKDESDKYLSETFKIRILPSLTTLKLIKDSPADYHSQTGTLIVGDPDVGHVLYKGRVEKITRLPSARKEAEMVEQLLGGQLLLGKQATKQAVLQSIKSVTLIHFAAHGDADRGEIVLAPPPSITGTPQEEDYLLTMAEISQVQLQVKLVVLSCCHSARGHIRAEGVVGIARAFLGSGARSVLVALWAIQDSATKEFMSRFYEHLVGGESASESLHQAMKWMRANGFSDEGQWAPFMLIGDNVTFDFGK